MKELIIDAGRTLTSDLFILNDRIYWRLIKEEQQVIQHSESVVSHCLKQTNEYIAWNYKTGDKRYITHDNFITQFDYFMFLKEGYDTFMDDTIQDVLDYELYPFMFISEHMY